jgi:hypothetical protein
MKKLEFSFISILNFVKGYIKYTLNNSLNIRAL